MFFNRKLISKVIKLNYVICIFLGIIPFKFDFKAGTVTFPKYLLLYNSVFMLVTARFCMLVDQVVPNDSTLRIKHNQVVPRILNLMNVYNLILFLLIINFVQIRYRNRLSNVFIQLHKMHSVISSKMPQLTYHRLFRNIIINFMLCDSIYVLMMISTYYFMIDLHHVRVHFKLLVVSTVISIPTLTLMKITTLYCTLNAVIQMYFENLNEHLIKTITNYHNMLNRDITCYKKLTANCCLSDFLDGLNDLVTKMQYLLRSLNKSFDTQILTILFLCVTISINQV